MVPVSRLRVVANVLDCVARDMGMTSNKPPMFLEPEATKGNIPKRARRKTGAIK
jgi:hypothetical protein